MNRVRKWISKLPPSIAVYCLSLLMIGVACSSIYWPAGLLVVGGLIWLDLFLADLIYVIKSNRDREGGG